MIMTWLLNELLIAFDVSMSVCSSLSGRRVLQ